MSRLNADEESGSDRNCGIVMLGWNDYVGITRCRSVPASRLDSVLADGLGWPAAGQSLTPFADIAPNPWGPMTEVRQVPDLSTRTFVDIWPDQPPFDLILCDSRNPDGSSWDCCTRAFLRAALEDLKSECGVELLAAFEHEFTVEGDLPTGAPFSIDSARYAARFTADLAEALTAAGLAPETVEPEFGRRQYEVTVSPSQGVSAGDRAIATREVIRECARRLGLRATFSPKPYVDGVGSGAHVHFSFVDRAGQNATVDLSHPSGASAIARSFIGGVMRHMPAICALVAPSPVSYFRLGPHRWSCGYASFGIQNREASIRICPSTSRDPQARARGFNLEFRPPDATASPYLVLGALVRAGLAGIRAGLDLPEVCSVDPAELTNTERARLGIVPLPGSLSAALDVMLADEEVRGWMSPLMLESYLGVKRAEQDLAASQTPEQTASSYRDVY